MASVRFSPRHAQCRLYHTIPYLYMDPDLRSSEMGQADSRRKRGILESQSAHDAESIAPLAQLFAHCVAYAMDLCRLRLRD